MRGPSLQGLKLLAMLKDGHWMRPAELGATSKSWHNGVLVRIYRQGLLYRRSADRRFFYEYKITPDGKQYLKDNVK